MVTRNKILLGAGIVIGALILLVVITFAGLGYYLSSDTASTKLYHDAFKEGPEFGRQTDQEGCLAQGSVRLAGSAEPTLGQRMANDVFLKECLANSRPSDGFCDDVPSIPYRDWIRNECRKTDKDADVCADVFDAKHTFCNGL